MNIPSQYIIPQRTILRKQGGYSASGVSRLLFWAIGVIIGDTELLAEKLAEIWAESIAEKAKKHDAL